MDKWKTIIIGLLVLTFAGCNNPLVESIIQPGGDNEISILQPSPYEAFVQKIQSENLSECGLDIVSMLEGHLSSPDVVQRLATKTDISRIDYTLEKCNFSKKNVPSYDDMIIKIHVGKDGEARAFSFYMTVIFAFVLNGNGQFDTVLNERFESAGYEIMDVTGDGRDEIVLIKDRDRYHQFINILSFDEENTMMVVFDEMLSGYILHPYTCHNRYQFVPAQAGGYDIIFYTMLYYTQDNIFETGSTRFVYNRNKYVVKGTYYDYQARGEAIVENVQNSKRK